MSTMYTHGQVDVRQRDKTMPPDHEASVLGVFQDCS